MCVRREGRGAQGYSGLGPPKNPSSGAIQSPRYSPEHWDRGGKFFAFNGYPPESGVLETLPLYHCTSIRGVGTLALPAFLFLV